MCEVNMEERYKDKEGQQYKNEVGTIIKQVVCCSKNFAGLLLERKNDDRKKILECIYDCNPTENPKHIETTLEYQRLQSSIQDNINFSDDDKIRLKTRLVRALHRAYIDNYKKRMKSYFIDIYEALEVQKASSIVEMFKQYSLILIFSFLLMLFLCELDEVRKLYYQSIFMGLLGSYVILCYSYDKVKVLGRETNSQMQWRYGSKLICGGIFGFIMLLVLKSNLIFPDIASNLYIQILFPFFAGFNAKWVPKIAESLATREQ